METETILIYRPPSTYSLAPRPNDQASDCYWSSAQLNDYYDEDNNPEDWIDVIYWKIYCIF